MSQSSAALTVVPAARPLSPARAELAVAISEVAAASAALAKVERPVAALQTVITAHAAAAAELAAARDSDSDELGAWLASGSVGERPARSIATGSAERRLAELAADAAGASKALPAAIEMRATAAERVAEAARRRDEALCVAAAEAAAELAPALAEAVKAVLVVEAKMRALAAALQSATDTGRLPGGAGAAGRIVAAVAAAKREPAVARDDEGGRAFLDRLAADAEAAL